MTGENGEGKSSTGGPSVSVVICAHLIERLADTLAAVDSVEGQSLAPAEIIVVVDHNPALHQRLTAELPGVLVLENSQARGLSGGRNTGIEAATSDIVAFLDDDAVADPDWLKFFAERYADPDVVGVGGLTLPAWVTHRPSWFPAEFDWVVGCTYVGMPTAPAPVRNVLGGNASYRRAVVQQVGGFRSGIGRSASKRPLGCEETELCIRIRQQRPGSVLFFDNRAMIWHKVPAPRVRFSYFLSRCYAEGLSKAMVTSSVGVQDGLATERGYTSRTLPAGFARGLRAALRGDRGGLGRSAAIVAGLAVAGAGYGAGVLQGKAADRRQGRGAGVLQGRAGGGRHGKGTGGRGGSGKDTLSAPRG
jgi:GT2 family glycosyltransferase